VILSILIVTIIPVFADTTVPSAPHGVSASAVSPTQVNLFWNAPSGFTITSYKIDYKAGSGSYTTLVTTSGTNATKTNYSNTGLTTGVQYSYKIYAINSVGTSVASAEITATPYASSVGFLPGSPTGLVATPISPTQASLSWNAPSNGGYPITGYKIEYRVGAGSYAELIPTTSSTSTTYSHTGMTAGQVYVYRVYAITSFGQSEKPSAETTVNLKPTSSASAPGAPPSLSATAVSPTQVNLSWSAPSNNGGYQISGYKIEVKKGSTAYSTLTANTGNSTTTYSHAGLVTGTTYSYKVYAINSIGTSTASPEASATPTVGSASSSPAPPAGLVATSASATQINLSWFAPSNNGGSPITGYKIEYKLGSSGTYSTLVANTANTAITYSHTGLTAGQAYVYRVSALNTVGSSNSSPESSATPTTSSQTTTSSAPGAPTGLVVMSVSGTQINLSWFTPSNAGGSPITGYQIESKKGTGSFEVIVPNTGSTITSYAHAGLTTGTQYYYRVYAINSIGIGGPSGESSASPKETTVPTLTGFAIAPTKIYLTWTAPSQTYKQPIGGYKIEEKLGTDSYKIIRDNTGSVNSYTVDNVIAGKTYTYTVTALFAAGSSPRSNEISVTPTSTSAPPAGFSTNTAQIPTTTSKPIGIDPQSILKAQQEEVKRKAQEAREAMLKQSGKGDSEKAKALREEAKRANEKAQQDALSAKQKLIADKKAAAIKEQQEKVANQTSKAPSESPSKKPKTLEEARKLAEEAKQKALDKANIDVKKSGSSAEEKQKALDAAKAAAWEKAKKALEELKAKSQK
jgi:uncharacterized membrane protein